MASTMLLVAGLAASAAFVGSAPTYPDKLSNPSATVGRGTAPNASETHVPGSVYTPYPQTQKGARVAGWPYGIGSLI